MKSYEVIRRAVDEMGVKAVAASLKVSPALVYKWCEPADEEGDAEPSGAKNPLDRVRELYALTKDPNLIDWLCQQAGGFFCENPKPDPQASMDQTIFGKTQKMVRDFSEFLDAVTASYDDDSSIDATESKEIRQKWQDLKRLVENFVVGCEQGLYHVKPKPTKGPAGPG